MAGARSEALWSHTSALLAMIFNAHRDPKKTKPARPDDWNPHARKRSVSMPGDIKLLKQAFVKPKSKGA